jgi:hypothetical protein
MSDLLACIYEEFFRVVNCNTSLSSIHRQLCCCAVSCLVVLGMIWQASQRRYINNIADHNLLELQVG